MKAARHRMNRFPAEFADLLTRKGRRILEGRDPETRDALLDPARFFVPISGAVDPDRARAIHALLDRRMRKVLSPLAAAIPEGSIWNQTRNYQERLPKTARARTAFLERRSGRAWRAAEASGLIAMMRSASFRAFAEAVAGRALDAEFGQQVLCYGPGDYAGPHTDHHPEDSRAAPGYVDFHVSFGSPAVAHQYLVYARGGHFSEMVDVNTPGGITVYRLPFWHYTTPLMARPGRAAQARRWVVLGTFLFAEAAGQVRRGRQA
jgi:hypothetical protein